VEPLRYDHQKAGEAEASPWGVALGAVFPQLHQKFWRPVGTHGAESDLSHYSISGRAGSASLAKNRVFSEICIQEETFEFSQKRLH
jgi:hypothetical protein